MKKYINGAYIDLTAEEIAAMNAEQTSWALREKSRPLTTGEVSRMVITNTINTLAVDDNTALRMVEFYPEWAANAAYTVGYKVQYGSRLWRCRQEHTAQTGWEPENAASLWEVINETHSGTMDDPIPYEGNMALASGLHYMQDYVLYRCIRDTEVPVYHPLAELTGVYVERL